MRKFLVLSLVLLLGGGLYGCIQQPVRPFSLAQAPRDPALVHGKLSNGFEYLVMRNTTPKERVSVHLQVFAGSIHERDGEEGIAHYLEHMLFNGSEHFKPGELVTYFQSIGMDFGADANARTSFFSTVYDLNLPKGDKAHLEDAFLVIRDFAGGALLLETEVDKERGVILAEKRERDSVSFRTFEKELAFEFPGSLLAKRLPIGDASVLNRADRATLKRFYDQWYRPDNMALVVVGDVDTALVQELVRKNFSHLTDRSTPLIAQDPDISWKPHHGVQTFFLHEPEASKTELTIERLVQVDSKPESLDDLKQQTVRFLGDLMLENRLSRMVREQTADFTDADAYSGVYLNQVFTAALKAECSPDQWIQALGQMENLLRQARVYGFQARELDRVKADFIASLASDLAGAETRKSSQLGAALLHALANKGLFLSPAQRLEILKPFVEALDLEAVNREFKASWQEDHCLVMVSGNADIPKNPQDRIRDAFETARHKEVSPYVLAEEKPFPYLTLPEKKKGLVRQETDVNGLGISRYTFGNQVCLNLKPTDYKKGEFRFTAVFGTGLAGQPRDLDGFSFLAQSLIDECGVGGMDKDQLNAALAGKEVSIGFRLSDAYLSLEGVSVTDQVPLVFQLLYAYLKDPGFKDKGLNLAKTRFRQAYEAMERTPDGIMQIRGEKFLSGGHAGFGLGHPDAADKVTLDQIRAWLLPQFTKGPLEISLAGDFDPQEVLEAAKTYLGALEDREAPVTPVPLQKGVAFPFGQTLALDLDTRIDKGVVRVAFRTSDYWDITRTRGLSMLSRVFSERLRKEIREKLGASYSPYVYNDPSMIFDGYGVMQAVVNTAPETFDLVTGQVEAIAADLAQTGVTQQELDLVKAPMLNHLAVLRQDNGYWLNSVMADSFRHPEKLAWAGHLIQGYQEISADQLSALTRQYLKQRALILIRPR